MAIVADTNEGGTEILIADDLLNKKHPLKAVFPLHNKTQLEYFQKERIRDCPPKIWMHCPLPHVRDYFGDHVACYFAFLLFYLKWLIASAIIGLIFFIRQVAVSEVAVTCIPFLCFCMIFWSGPFVDFWARTESCYRLMWGMTKFKQKAVARPQFKGEWQHDSVAGFCTEGFSLFRRACRASAIYTFVSIWLSCCVVAVIYILLQRDKNPNNLLLKIGLEVANAVTIFIFDAIYKVVSHFCNNWENHRTEKDFQNGTIYKALYTPTIVYIIFRVYIRLKGCISIQLNQYGVERFNNINFILIIIGYGIIYPMNKIIISIDVLVIFVMFVHNKLRVIRIISNAWLKLCNELIVFIHELIEIMHKQKLAVIFDEYFLLFRVITMFTMMICIAASCALYIPTMKSFTLLVCTIFEMNIRLMRRIPINLNHNGFDRLNNIILVFIVLGHVVLLLLYSVNEIYIYDTYNDCVFLRPTSDVILDIGIYNNLTNAYTI